MGRYVNDVQSPDSSANAGSKGISGWLNQRDVSIWMALEFFFVSNSAEVIQPERASYEDAETDSSTGARDHQDAYAMGPLENVGWLILRTEMIG
jgi:hypothetical protein